MTVVLLPEYKKDRIIHKINDILYKHFGSTTEEPFYTTSAQRREIRYLNEDPEGLKQVSDWPRPITASILEKQAFWYRVGEFSLKLSGGSTSLDAMDAIAVCKWIQLTKGHYINARLSSHYDPTTIADYLKDQLTEEGFDLLHIWQLPKLGNEELLPA